LFLECGGDLGPSVFGKWGRGRGREQICGKTKEICFEARDGDSLSYGDFFLPILISLSVSISPFFFLNLYGKRKCIDELETNHLFLKLNVNPSLSLADFFLPSKHILWS